MPPNVQKYKQILLPCFLIVGVPYVYSEKGILTQSPEFCLLLQTQPVEWRSRKFSWNLTTASLKILAVCDDPYDYYDIDITKIDSLPRTKDTFNFNTSPMWFFLFSKAEFDLVGALGGDTGITPNFDKRQRRFGFSNLYATGQLPIWESFYSFRPGQPVTSYHYTKNRPGTFLHQQGI